MNKKARMNKKASMFDVIIWIVVSFVIIMFFGIWIYGFNLLTNTLVAVPSTASVNISEAAQNSFSQINSAQTTGLHILAYVLMFGMALSILVANFLVKSHPAFFILYILITIVAIMVAVPISNEYETLMSDAVLGATLQGFKGGSFIMLHLPIWVTVIGLFGAIFLFAGISRDQGLGGGVL